MAATYEPIATTTLASAQNSIQFSSIASSWTDLRVVITGKSTTGGLLYLRLNSDTGSNYSTTSLYATPVASYRTTNSTHMDITDANVAGLDTTNPTFYTIDLMSYAGSTYKTCLIEGSQQTNGVVYRMVGLWRSTSAINDINFYLSSGNFTANTTITLFGIKAA